MSAHQLLLDGPTRADEIEAAARRFRNQNPEAYDALVALAREERRAGITRGSINRLFEVMRRNRLIRSAGAEDYLLNNNARAPLARWIMAEHTDLDGFFEIRERRSEDAPPRGGELHG